MSAMTFTRRTRSRDITVGPAAAVSTSVDMGDMAAGMVHVSGVTSTATIAVYGSGDGVTFVPLHAHDGQPATIAVQADGSSAPLPDAAYALRYVRLVASDELGTAAAVEVSLKS